jgi:hypothetical protein
LHIWQSVCIQNFHVPQVIIHIFLCIYKKICVGQVCCIYFYDLCSSFQHSSP